MSASNRYRNVTVSWTPAAGSPVTLTGIKGASYDEGNQNLMEAADGDLYHTVGGVIMSSPKITIESIDAMSLFATLAGTKGTLVVTLRDFYNGSASGGGAKQFTLSNAFLGARTMQAQYNQLAHQSLTFDSISTDGQTHPLSITAL